MPRYHLPNGQVYTSDQDLSPADLEHLASSGGQPSSLKEPSFLDRIGGWRGVAGGAIRAGSGILSAEGGLPGAGISGAGEALAELAEGSDFSPTKIGVESGFGAIPFGKVVKGGALLGSALRSGALGAAHTAVSEAAGGNIPSAKDVAVSGGLGALLGGAGSKFVGAGKTTGTPTTYEIQPTAQTGPGARVMAKKGMGLSLPLRPIKGTGAVDMSPTAASAESLAGVPYAAEEPAPYRAAAKKIVSDELKARENQTKADQISNLIEEGGLTKGKPSVSENLSATGPEGERLSARTPYRKPKTLKAGEWMGDEEGADLLDETTAIKRPADAPPSGTAAGDVYDSWIAHGRDHKTALRLTIKGLPPRQPAPGAAIPPVVGGNEPQPIVAAVKSKRQGASKVQKFNKGIEDILGMTEQPKAAVTEPAAPQTVIPETSVSPAVPEPVPGQPAGFFKSPVDVVGAAYRGAKGETGINPLAKQQLGVALQSEAKKAGLPTRGPGDLKKFLSEKIAPELEATQEKAVTSPQPKPQVEETWEGVPAEDWVQRELDAIERLKKGESGAVSGALLGKLGASGLGALVGAPVGQAADPEDPYAAVKGALAGGLMGYGGAKGLIRANELGRSGAQGVAKELTNIRNAGLLSGPAQIKKPLSDIGAAITAGAEDMFNLNTRDRGIATIKELFRLPTNVQNYMKALKDPELAGEVIGDTLRSSDEADRGLLGMVGRPFGAAQYSTQQMLERAGHSPEEARDILFLGDPKTQLGKWWLSAQDPTKTGAVGSRIVRAIRPFTRIATNLAERGMERIPGPSLMMGDPETRAARTVLGAGAFGAGGLTGASDAASEAAGEKPTSPSIRGLRRAALASYGLPFILGEAAFGPRGARDLYYAIPGINSIIQPPAPKDTLASFSGKLAKEWFKQMIPNWVLPADAEKPLR